MSKIKLFHDVEGVEIIIEKIHLKLPHVIASTSTESGLFSIRTGRLIKGNLSQELADRIETWIVINDEEIMKHWGESKDRETSFPMQKISEFFETSLEMGFEQDYTPFIQATHHQISAHFSLYTGDMIDVLKGGFDDFAFKPRSLVSAWIIIHKTELLNHWHQLVENPQTLLSQIRPLQ